MKSTYELLSIFLDNRDLPKPVPQLIALSEVPECADVGEDYNLFDLPVCRRTVSSMRLLSAMSAAEASSLADTISGCREIIVLLDYNSASRIACSLYIKRVLQAITILSEGHPELTVILAGDVKKWTDQLQMIYAE